VAPVFYSHCWGAALKVVAKVNLGHLAVVSTGLVVVDHAYHESGLKMIIDW